MDCQNENIEKIICRLDSTDAGDRLAAVRAMEICGHLDLVRLSGITSVIESGALLTAHEDREVRAYAEDVVILCVEAENDAVSPKTSVIYLEI